MTDVKSTRDALHLKIKDTEPIDVEKLKKVNTFSRLERMKKKTAELTEIVCALMPMQNKDRFLEFYKLLNEYNLLVIDWVYGNELEWDGSFPDKQIEKIMALLKSKNNP